MEQFSRLFRRGGLAVQVNLISNLEGPDCKKTNIIDGGKSFTIGWMRMQRGNLRIVKGSHTITAINGTYLRHYMIILDKIISKSAYPDTLRKPKYFTKRLPKSRLQKTDLIRARLCSTRLETATSRIRGEILMKMVGATAC
jgi:hypothetical protein